MFCITLVDGKNGHKMSSLNLIDSVWTAGFKWRYFTHRPSMLRFNVLRDYECPWPCVDCPGTSWTALHERRISVTLNSALNATKILFEYDWIHHSDLYAGASILKMKAYLANSLFACNNLFDLIFFIFLSTIWIFRPEGSWSVVKLSTMQTASCFVSCICTFKTF